MKTTLSSIQQERLADLILLSNHGGRDQWHGLRCHHINNGQFTATYGDLAERWGVSRSVVYSTIKKFIKLGLITAEKFERATLFTIIESHQATDCNVATCRESDSYVQSPKFTPSTDANLDNRSKIFAQKRKKLRKKRKRGYDVAILKVRKGKKFNFVQGSRRNNKIVYNNWRH